MSSQSIDVFISHNSKDKGFLDNITKRLNDEYDIQLWLDKWSLQAATDWAPAIEKALQTCTCCAIVLGANGWGPHHLGEAQLALKRKREHPNFRVIPILLPGATADNMQVLGDFFQQVHRVEFTGEANEEEAFQRLWAAIRGEVPGPPLMTAYKIERDAKYWQRLPAKNKNSALYAGEKLRNAQEIATRKDEPISEIARAFLQAGVEDERYRIQQAQRRTQKIIGGLAVGLILVTILAAVALIQRNLAQEAAQRERDAKDLAVQAAEREKKAREEAVEAATRETKARADEETQRKKAEESARLERVAKEQAEKNAAEARRQQGIAETNATEAKRQQGIAEVNEKQAAHRSRLNIAQRLATQSDVQTKSNPQRAGLWAAEAIEATLKQDGNMTSEARAAANRALATINGTGHHGYFRESVTSVIFNKDEGLVAAADWGGIVQVFDLSQPFPQSLRHVIYTDEFTSVVAFDTNSRHLITHLKARECQPGIEIRKKTQGCGPGLVWTLEEGRKFSSSPISLPDGPFESMAASRDNLLLAAATANEVIIYDLASPSGPRVLRRLQKSASDTISVLEFSKDRSLLLSGSHNGWVQVWDLTSEGVRPKTQFKSSHRANQLGRDRAVPIEIIHIADDRSALVTASRDWIGDSTQADLSAKLWNLDNLKPVGTPRLLTHNQAITSVDFIMSGRLVITTSLDGAVRRWSSSALDTTAPKMLATARCDCNPSDPFRNIQSAAVAPDDNLLAMATSDGTVRLISLTDTAKGPVDLRGHLPNFLTISLSGKWLVSGGADRSLRVWSIDKGALGPDQSLVGNWQAQYVAAEVSSLGMTGVMFTADQIEVWDISNSDSPRQLSTLKSSLGKQECPTCQVNISPDGKWLVVQSDSEKNMSIVRTVDGSMEFTIPVRTWGITGESQFSPDSRWLLVAKDDGGRLYDLSKRPVTSASLGTSEESIYFGSAKFSKDSKWLFADTAAYSKSRKAVGYLWRLNSQHRGARRFEIADFNIGQSKFSDDGRWFAYSAYAVGDYRDQSGLSLRIDEPQPPETLDQRELTSVRLIRLTEEAEKLETTKLYGHELKPTRMVFSTDGRWLLTATDDILARERMTRVRIWDLRQKNIAEKPFTLPTLDRYLREAVFSHDGRFLVTIQGTDDFARLWYLDNSHDQFVAVSTLRGGIPKYNYHWTVMFSPDSKRVVIATRDDPTPYLWFLSPNGLYSNARQLRAGDQGMWGMQFSQDGTKLLSLSSNTRGSQLNIFNVERPDREVTMEEIFSSDKDNLYQFKLSQDVQRVLVIGKGLRVLRIHDGESLIALLSRVVARNMTWEEWVLSGLSGPYHKTFQKLPVPVSVLRELTKRVAAGEKIPASVPINELVAWTIEFDEPGVCNELAWSLAMIGEARQSLRAVDCALKHFPNNGNYRDTRGVARTLLGDTDGAIEDFKAFIESAIKNGEKIETIEERRRWVKEISNGRNPFLPNSRR